MTSASLLDVVLQMVVLDADELALTGLDGAGGDFDSSIIVHHKESWFVYRSI